MGGQIGQYSSCRLINDLIGITYYDIALDRLRYITVDSQYKNVSDPITIEDVSVTNVCKMAIVSDRPAIFYIAADDETGDSVWKYIWATNSSGTAWFPPIVLETANTDLSFGVNNLFLLIVNGNPVVFFHNESNEVQLIKSINSSGGAGWELPVTISDLTSHNILDVKQISGVISIVAKSSVTNQVYYVYSVDAGVTWTDSVILNKFDNTPLIVNASSSSNAFGFINGVMCLISSELTTNKIYVNVLNGTEWLGYKFLTDVNTSSVFPSVFTNNDTTYLLYTSYSGSASKKTLVEFSNTFITDNTFVQTDGFIDNFNFGTDQQIIQNLNDGNNAIILGSNSGLSILKFYGNDFAISWSALI